MKLAIGVFMLLGPGEVTFSRTRDLLDSFWCHCDPGIDVDLTVVNDNSQYLDDLQDRLGPFRQVTILSNPLTDKPCSLMDRLTAGALHGLEVVSKSHDYEYLLKFDDDALVIGDFHPRLSRFFKDHPSAGMIGTYSRFPDGSERPGNSTWAGALEKSIALNRVVPEVKRHYRGHTPFARYGDAFRRFVIGRRALAHGYKPGWHVQGGSFALSMKAVTNMMKFLSHPLGFSYTGVGDDMVISLLVKSAGLELIDYNKTEEVFGVWWRVPAFSPDELLARGYAVVHSIKYDDEQEESRVREFFRSKRASRSRGVGASYSPWRF